MYGMTAAKLLGVMVKNRVQRVSQPEDPEGEFVWSVRAALRRLEKQRMAKRSG